MVYFNKMETFWSSFYKRSVFALYKNSLQFRMNQKRMPIQYWLLLKTGCPFIAMCRHNMSLCSAMPRKWMLVFSAVKERRSRYFSKRIFTIFLLNDGQKGQTQTFRPILLKSVSCLVRKMDLIEYHWRRDRSCPTKYTRT